MAVIIYPASTAAQEFPVIYDDASMLGPVLDIARDAGDHIMRIYETDFEVTTKSDKSPVTEADLAAHKAIVMGLQRLTPEIPVLSEESSKIPFEERRRWESYWLVDPLDGTKEFINRNGDFTVNIALIQNGEPVAGVVYMPTEKNTYYGSVGAGAFRREANGSEHPIHVQVNAADPVRVVASRSHRGELLDSYLAKLGANEIVSRGSSLKFCLVAEGAADVYPRLGPTCEWDTGAGHAVLLAAGGRVLDVDGNPLRYNAKESLLNPHFIAYADTSRNWLDYL